jgi:hypothetical protein
MPVNVEKAQTLRPFRNDVPIPDFSNDRRHRTYSMQYIRCRFYRFGISRQGQG